LKLKCDEPLSNFAYNFNVRRYTMGPQAISNTVWSYATLGLMPTPEGRATIEVAVVREGWGMNAQHVSNTWYGFATALRWEPGAAARAALEAALTRVGPVMNAQDVSNIVLSHATLRLMPGWGGAGCQYQNPC
jgi:hypothetical protein